MYWPIDLIVLTFVIFCAIAAISVKDLLGTAILFGAFQRVFNTAMPGENNTGQLRLQIL